MDDIRQLKLSTGEEVVCEILDWADEQEGDIVVRNMIDNRDITIDAARRFLSPKN